MIMIIIIFFLIETTLSARDKWTYLAFLRSNFFFLRKKKRYKFNQIINVSFFFSTFRPLNARRTGCRQIFVSRFFTFFFFRLAQTCLDLFRLKLTGFLKKEKKLWLILYQSFFFSLKSAYLINVRIFFSCGLSEVSNFIILSCSAVYFAVFYCQIYFDINIKYWFFTLIFHTRTRTCTHVHAHAYTLGKLFHLGKPRPQRINKFFLCRSSQF